MTKVWVASHAHAAAVNHDKLRALAQSPDIDLTVLAPRRLRTPLSVVRLPERASSYRVAVALWPSLTLELVRAERANIPQSA